MVTRPGRVLSMPANRTSAPLTAVAAAAAAAVACVLASVSSAVALTGQAPLRTPVCVTTGPLSGLSAAQAINARTVAAVALPRGGQRAALIAVDVAMTESSLLVLGNPAVAGRAPTGQGVGYDHDSVGLFQQRAGWGSAAQRMDPVESTGLFLDALLAIPGWDQLPPWVAAQVVQRSAFDGHPTPENGGATVIGGNYLAHLTQANNVLGAITGGDQGATCGDAAVTGSPVSPGRFGLPASYAVPAGTSRAGQVAVVFALAQLGKPYQWGATGPDRYDCSGLAQSAWQHAGMRISRVTTDQAGDGTPTTLSGLLPGDLVLTPGSDGSLAAPGHVGMYLGAGLVISAPKTGDVVHVVTLASFTARGLSALRHIA